MRVAVVVLGVFAAGSAFAQGRPTTTALNCAQAARIVASQGAIVMNTAPYVYDRYVSGGNFCQVMESTEPAWVPTADNPQCFIGYRCRGTAQRQSSR